MELLLLVLVGDCMSMMTLLTRATSTMEKAGHLAILVSGLATVSRILPHSSTQDLVDGLTITLLMEKL